MLRGILNPRERWNKDSENNREFLESLNDWEILIGEYRAASGENVSDRVLIATILEHAPSRYQDIFRANSRKKIILRCDGGLRTIVYLRVSMVSQASLEGQFRWTSARSKAISLARARRARARAESRMASMSKESSSPRRGQATKRVEATYMLRRSFRATVGTSRHGDINGLTVGKDNESKNQHQHLRFEFYKRGAGCHGRTFRGGVEGEGRQMVLCIGDRFEFSSGQG